MRFSFFSLFPISIFLLLFPLTFHGATGNKLVRDTCKLISQDTSNVKYDFCKTSLQAAWERYYYPNLEALGSVSLTLVKNSVTDTRSYIIEYQIKAWKNNSSQPHVRTRLQDCFKLHSDAIDDLEKAVKSYKSQKYTEVREEATAALAFLTTCEERFKNRGLVSPLTKRYNKAVQLTAIALHILSMLH